MFVPDNHLKPSSTPNLPAFLFPCPKSQVSHNQKPAFKKVYPEPWQDLKRRISAPIYGWDGPSHHMETVGTLVCWYLRVNHQTRFARVISSIHRREPEFRVGILIVEPDLVQSTDQIFNISNDGYRTSPWAASIGFTCPVAPMLSTDSPEFMELQSLVGQTILVAKKTRGSLFGAIQRGSEQKRGF